MRLIELKRWVEADPQNEALKHQVIAQAEREGLGEEGLGALVKEFGLEPGEAYVGHLDRHWGKKQLDEYRPGEEFDGVDYALIRLHRMRDGWSYYKDLDECMSLSSKPDWETTNPQAFQLYRSWLARKVKNQRAFRRA